MRSSQPRPPPRSSTKYRTIRMIEGGWGLLLRNLRGEREWKGSGGEGARRETQRRGKREEA
eukprot:2974097-Rhodomonas_salina.1